MSNVSQNSINTFRVIGPLISAQEFAVLHAMDHGKQYTRRELGVLAGIENSAAARTVNGLVKADRLIETGTKKCDRTGRMVGSVMLALSEGP